MELDLTLPLERHGPERPRRGGAHAELSRDDARRLTQCLDLFVLTSLSEGTSVALLEAMAAGVPVAVTDVGGNPEIVDPALTGWLVPSDDAGALAGVVRAAASDPARRPR